MEFKEAAEYLGLKVDEIKTIDDFKTAFDKEFLRTSSINEDSEPVKKILGKTFGTLENEIKKVAKAHELEVDFDSEDLKGKKVTDKLKFVFSKYDEKQNVVLEDLKLKATQGNDDKVKDWEQKFNKISQKNTDLQNLLNTTNTDFESYKQDSGKQIKSVKLDVFKKDVLSKIKFKSDISEFEKKGYLSVINDKYDFDFDDQENFIMKDKKGALIPSTKQTGKFKEPLEILEEEAVTGKLFQLNKDGGTPAKPTFATNTQNQQQNTGAVNQRKVAPRMG